MAAEIYELFGGPFDGQRLGPIEFSSGPVYRLLIPTELAAKWFNDTDTSSGPPRHAVYRGMMRHPDRGVVRLRFVGIE